MKLKIGRYFIYFSYNNSFPTKPFFIEHYPKDMLGNHDRLTILQGVLWIFFFYVLKIPKNYDPIKEIEKTHQEYIIAMSEIQLPNEIDSQ